MSKVTQFLISWDNQGLEYIGNITEYQHDATWSALKGTKPTAELANINHLMLRARYNTHRHYEIYVVSAVDGITKEDIQDMFESAPQQAADTIRRLGQKIYSDRCDESKILIK